MRQGICHRALATLAAVAALALPACDERQGESKAGQADDSVAPAAAVVDVSSPLPGRMYLKAGRRALDADLYQFIPSAKRLDRLTTNARIDAVTGCPGAVIVAASQAEVGLDSHLQEFRDGQLRPLPGLGRPPGYLPTASSDCRLAYVWYSGNRSTQTQEVLVWQPGQTAPAAVASGPAGDIATKAWGPGGELALATGPYQGPETVVIRPAGGGERVVGGLPSNVGALAWSRSGLLAVDAMDTGGGGEQPVAVVFADSAGGGTVKGRIEGWTVIHWSPDGDTLLVVDTATSRHLAAISVDDLATVMAVAELDTPVWDGIWLSGDGPSPIEGPSPLQD